MLTDFLDDRFSRIDVQASLLIAMKTRTSLLLEEAKRQFGVKTDKDFCEKTGASPSVIRRWRDGSVNAVNSSLVNVQTLCGPLEMSLDDIYVYLTTGERPKKNNALNTPAIAGVFRAYDELRQAFETLQGELGMELKGQLHQPKDLLTALFDRAAAEVDQTVSQILSKRLDPSDAENACFAYKQEKYNRAIVVIICATLSLERESHSLPALDPQTALLLWVKPEGNPMAGSPRDAELGQAEERTV